MSLEKYFLKFLIAQEDSLNEGYLHVYQIYQCLPSSRFLIANYFLFSVGLNAD